MYVFFSQYSSSLHIHRDGHLDSTALSGYSRSLADTLQQLMHPDPAQRPSAPFLATHYLYSQYPSAGTRKSTIFRTQSTSSGSGDSGGEGGEMVENLLRENAELRARLAQA